jgi:hypothetical protein
MRHVLTALLSAGAICAFASATPAAAQTYGAWPFGVGSTFAGSSPTIASHTGAPTYSWRDEGPWLAPGGQCQIVSGNRVCTANSVFGPFAFGYGLSAR